MLRRSGSAIRQTSLETDCAELRCPLCISVPRSVLSGLNAAIENDDVQGLFHALSRAKKFRLKASATNSSVGVADKHPGSIGEKACSQPSPSNVRSLLLSLQASDASDKSGPLLQGVVGGGGQVKLDATIMLLQQCGKHTSIKCSLMILQAAAFRVAPQQDLFKGIPQNVTSPPGVGNECTHHATSILTGSLADLYYSLCTLDLGATNSRYQELYDTFRHKLDMVDMLRRVGAEPNAADSCLYSHVLDGSKRQPVASQLSSLGKQNFDMDVRNSSATQLSFACIAKAHQLADHPHANYKATVLPLVNQTLASLCTESAAISFPLTPDSKMDNAKSRPHISPPVFASDSNVSRVFVHRIIQKFGAIDPLLGFSKAGSNVSAGSLTQQEQQLSSRRAAGTVRMNRSNSHFEGSHRSKLVVDQWAWTALVICLARLRAMGHTLCSRTPNILPSNAKLFEIYHSKQSHDTNRIHTLPLINSGVMASSTTLQGSISVNLTCQHVLQPLSSDSTIEFNLLRQWLHAILDPVESQLPNYAATSNQSCFVALASSGCKSTLALLRLLAFSTGVAKYDPLSLGSSMVLVDANFEVHEQDDTGAQPHTLITMKSFSELQRQGLPRSLQIQSSSVTAQQQMPRSSVTSDSLFHSPTENDVADTLVELTAMAERNHGENSMFLSRRRKRASSAGQTSKRRPVSASGDNSGGGSVSNEVVAKSEFEKSNVLDTLDTFRGGRNMANDSHVHNSGVQHLNTGTHVDYQNSYSSSGMMEPQANILQGSHTIHLFTDSCCMYSNSNSSTSSSLFDDDHALVFDGNSFVGQVESDGQCVEEANSSAFSPQVHDLDTLQIPPQPVRPELFVNSPDKASSDVIRIATDGAVGTTKSASSAIAVGLDIGWVKPSDGSALTSGGWKIPQWVLNKRKERASLLANR